MSSDDDAILSSYLDGQLDADSLQRVESALVASPRLTENLRALAAVRDLVAGLPRDTAVDVGPEVMMRIRGLNRPRTRPALNRPWAVWARGIALGAGSVSVAASILLLLAVVFARPGNRDQRAAAPKRSDNFIAHSGPGTSEPQPSDRAVSIAIGAEFSATNDTPNDLEAIDASTHTGNRSGEPIAFGSSSSPRDLELAREMLENPVERRLFFIGNAGDASAEQKVASVVERTSRFAFFKITVTQGIVIDPRHPDEATVFALLVSPKELGRLRDQLSGAFPDAVEESHTEPGIVTQLADIREVQQFAPLPAAVSSTPAGVLALRTEERNAERGATAPASVKARKRPTAEQERSAPIPPHAVRSRGDTDGEPARAVATVDNRPQVTEAPVASPHSSDPLANAPLAPTRPEPTAKASEPARSDEKVLVFVWVRHSRPS